MRVSKTNLATEQVLSVRALNLLQPHGAPSRVCVCCVATAGETVPTTRGGCSARGGHRRVWAHPSPGEGRGAVAVLRAAGGAAEAADAAWLVERTDARQPRRVLRCGLGGPRGALLRHHASGACSRRARRELGRRNIQRHYRVGAPHELDKGSTIVRGGPREAFRGVPVGDSQRAFWLCASRSKGSLTLTYTTTGPGCAPDWDCRKRLKEFFLCGRKA